MSSRERDVEKYVSEEVRKLGGLSLKFVSPGNDGMPDRILVFPDGRALFVELKTDVGRLSKVQEFQIGRLLDRGQQVCVVYGMAGAREFIRDMKDHCVSSVVYDKEGSYEIPTA